MRYIAQTSSVYAKDHLPTQSSSTVADFRTKCAKRPHILAARGSLEMVRLIDELSTMQKGSWTDMSS